MTLMTGRGSHQSCSIEKGVLKNFAIFTKTPVLEPLFNKVVRLQAFF